MRRQILNNKRSVTAKVGSKDAPAVNLNKKIKAALRINTSLKAIIE